MTGQVQGQMCTPPETFAPVFERSLGVLQSAVDQFKQYRAGKSTV